MRLPAISPGIAETGAGKAQLLPIESALEPSAIPARPSNASRATVMRCRTLWAMFEAGAGDRSGDQGHESPRHATLQAV